MTTSEHCEGVADIWDSQWWQHPVRNAAHGAQQAWHNAVNAYHKPRVQLFSKSLKHLLIGGLKGSAAVAGVVAAPETGGLSLALTVYGGVGASGDLTAGTFELLSSLFASDADLGLASNVGDIAADIATVSGAATFIAGGSVDTANRAAAVEDIVTTAGTAGFTGDAPKIGDWLGLDDDLGAGDHE
jgi:hypothetical protein